MIQTFSDYFDTRIIYALFMSSSYDQSFKDFDFNGKSMNFTTFLEKLFRTIEDGILN